MRIGRTLPPAAVPIVLSDCLRGLMGVFFRKRNLSLLEFQMRDYFGVQNVFLVGSGKAALALILLGLKSLSPKRKVVVPAYTCFSVPSAIIQAGLDISVCDIDPKTLDFDYTCLERSIDAETLAVIPTDLLGVPSDIDRVRALCKDKGIFVIEDAAQAMGVKYNGKHLGTHGDVGFFSLGRGKAISCGSGGIIVTDSERIAQSISAEYERREVDRPVAVIKNFLEVCAMYLLMRPWLYWLPAQLAFLGLGETRFYNDFPVHQMDGVRVGLLAKWQERLEQSNRARLKTARYLLKRLDSKREILCVESSEKTVFLRFPILMRDYQEKERLCSIAKQSGLGISPLYPSSIGRIKEIQGRIQCSDLQGASVVADRLVTIPVHHLVQQQDLDIICDLLDRSLSSTIVGHSEDASQDRRVGQVRSKVNHE